MKAADIRELTQEEMAKKLEDARRELLNLRIQAKIGQLENTARIRHVRRDIARMITENTVRARQNETKDTP